MNLSGRNTLVLRWHNSENMEEDNSLIQNIPCDCVTIQRQFFNAVEDLATPTYFLYTEHEKRNLLTHYSYYSSEAEICSVRMH